MKFIKFFLFIIIISTNCNSQEVNQLEDVLLDNIISDCSIKPSFTCVSNNTYKYFDTSFKSAFWNITDNIKFEKNNEEPAEKSLTSFRKGRILSDDLYDKAKHFLSNHDLTWQLPDTFFGGSTLKVSSNSKNSRSLFQIELLTPEDDEDTNLTVATGKSDEQGRLLFKKLFGKHIKKRLLLGFFALLLIIKLIKIKLFFLLPLILGVGTVKKLVIKFLFFIFPALAALFKSCHHYHHHVPVKQYHLHTVKHAHPPSSHHGHYDEYPHGPPDWLRRNQGVNEYYDTSSNNNNNWDTSAYDSSAEAFRRVSTVPSIFDQKQIRQNTFKTSRNEHTPVEPIPISNESYDPYYSSKLQSIDSVFSELGYNDEGCREQVICNMYKNPLRYSPHSNIISNHLSVDPKELLPPRTANEPVRRFFKYIQAAKDGQDQKDCVYVYPNCSVNTENTGL